MRARTFIVLSVGAIAGASAAAACVSDAGTNVFTNNEGGAGNDDGAVASNGDGSGGADAGGTIKDAAGGIDADSGIDAGPVPLQLDQAGELALWLEASPQNFQLDVTGNIVQWTDLSQHKNHATCQAGTCPGVHMNAIGAHASVQFMAGNAPFAIKDATSLQFGSDHVAIFLVAKTPTAFALYTKDTCMSTLHACVFETGLQIAPTPFQVDGGDGGTYLDFSVAMADGVNGETFTYGASVFDDKAFHIVGLRRYSGGTAMRLYVDERDASDNATSVTDISQAGNDITLGPIPDGFGVRPAATIDVAEIVVVHSTAGAIADSSVDDLRAYLAKKYGL
jgi:hypothetical protein